MPSMLTRMVLKIQRGSFAVVLPRLMMSCFPSGDQTGGDAALGTVEVEELPGLGVLVQLADPEGILPLERHDRPSGRDPRA